MKLITTHTNTDFDGLAAMVAAQKLYPDAELVLPGKLARNVEEFVALHRDILDLHKPGELRPGDVDTLILVDTKNARRLAKLAALTEHPGLRIHIFDHHPWAEGDIRGEFELVEPVGAATTLLVEEIRARNLAVTPFEATVLALGIYEDTGSLLYTNTTQRDLEAAAYLIGLGANLALVGRFLARPLTDEQQELLRHLLLSAERHLVNGQKILIARSSVDEFIGGLAVLTHKLSEIEHIDAVFSVVEMEDRVHIVARSSVPEVDVREILSHFGGGGHPAAASATIKGQSLDHIANELLDTIRMLIHPPVTAREIMSSPVKSVPPDMRVEEANQIMLRYGHTGLPVVENGHLMGIISRRDVEKADRHNLRHAPVKAFMTKNVLVAAPDTPLTEIQHLMIENNIGRLPIVDGHQLAGIVSRTDILKTLHKKFKPRFCTLFNSPQQEMGYQNMAEVLRRNLSAEALRILSTVGRIGRDLGCRVYLTGGMVRDALLGRPSRDYDLVVEDCDGATLGDRIVAALGGKLKVAEAIDKAQVFLPQGPRLDITMARRHFDAYGKPLDGVDDSPLRHELYGRDFTINAIAVVLNPEGFGDVIDHFGGRDDLQHGLIRALHNLSFIEDPIRILRAVRYEQRYRFNIERQTLALMREALTERALRTVPDEQQWAEVKRMLDKDYTPRTLARLAQLNIWPHLFPKVTYWEVQPVVGRIPRVIRRLQEWEVPPPAELWLCYFTAILHSSPMPLVLETCSRYKIGRRQTENVVTALESWRQAVRGFSSPNTSLVNLARIYLQLPREAYPLVLVMLEEERLQYRFRDVAAILKKHKPSITGKDIRSLGYRPGPLFRKALDAVWQARLEGHVKNKQEELDYAMRVMGLDNGPGTNAATAQIAGRSE
ncbi:MAG: CBS domain-containing protein [Thermoanaerobacterales bacterium]|nr:CBS domain-containing protein [Thermoanaerobacterales bacterium]